MPSAWGDAWSTNWGDSWGITAGPPPPPPPPPVGVPQYPSGGYPTREFRDAIEGRVPRGTLRLPEKAQAVIEAVALRQVETLEADELKRLEELERELQLKGIEWEARHLEALNVRREHLIDLEIGRLLKAKLEADDELLLIMLAASI